MARSYAALPYEYLDEMAVLTDEEFGRLARALLRFSSTGEEPELTGNERFFWRRVVNRELGLQQHYRELAAIRSEAGKKGMASRWGGITNDNKHNKVNVQDKAKDKVYSLPSTDGKRRGAAGAAQTERMKRDMAEMAKLTEGGARGPREAAPRLSGERTSTGMSEFLPQAETKDMEVVRT